MGAWVLINDRWYNFRAFAKIQFIGHNRARLRVDRIGALFADKAQVHTVFFAIGINHSGVKVFTLPTGDQLLLFYEAADIERSDASGRWQFLGGSGFYEGIRSSGTYTAKEIWYDGARIDFFEGAYELPNRYSDQLGSVIQDSLVEDGTK